MTVTNSTDAEFVQACRDGHREAFDVIVERHRRHVYQLCYRFVGNHEDANDLAQDVFIRAYRGLKTFKSQASLGTWLYRIGVNVCLNHVSSKGPGAEPLEPLIEANDQRVATQDESAADALLRGERAAQVRAAIAKSAEKAARDARAAGLSRPAARGDRRDPGKLGRRCEGQLLSRAEQPEEAAAEHAMTPAGTEFVDAAERLLGAPRAAHLERCERCRAQAQRTCRRGTRPRAVEVPEPSPLFWEHFRARVRDQVAARSAERAPSWTTVASVC